MLAIKNRKESIALLFIIKKNRAHKHSQERQKKSRRMFIRQERRETERINIRKKDRRKAGECLFARQEEVPGA